MALTVASTSSASANDGNSVTVTAPTGISTGDLLLLIGSHGDRTTALTSTDFTESISVGDNALAGQRSNITVLYKIAVLADESEANYTLTGSTGEMGAAFMMRITGWNTGDPVYFSSNNVGTIDTTDGLSVSETISTTRQSDQVHIIVAGAHDDANFTGDITTDTYSISSSDSNPTWTEIAELFYETGGATSNYGQLAVAYATSTGSSDLTGYGLQYNETGLAAATRASYLYLMLLEPLNATGTPSFVSSSGTAFEPDGFFGTAGSPSFMASSGTEFASTGLGSTPTVWTPGTKPSTTWTQNS